MKQTEHNSKGSKGNLTRPTRTAIKGMKITLDSLSSSIFPSRQYSMSTYWGILYLALKAFAVATILTGWANPIIRTKE